MGIVNLLKPVVQDKLNSMVTQEECSGWGNVVYEDGLYWLNFRRRGMNSERHCLGQIESYAADRLQAIFAAIRRQDDAFDNWLSYDQADPYDYIYGPMEGYYDDDYDFEQEWCGWWEQNDRDEWYGNDEADDYDYPQEDEPARHDEGCVRQCQCNQCLRFCEKNGY